jgi:hypothetical protein
VSAGHSELLALLERQVELADADRWDELVVAMDEWRERAGTLPPAAPAAAREPLARLAEAHDRLQARLTAARAATALELRALHRARGAVRGYEAAALVPGGQVDGSA